MPLYLLQGFNLTRAHVTLSIFYTLKLNKFKENQQSLCPWGQDLALTHTHGGPQLSQQLRSKRNSALTTQRSRAETSGADAGPWAPDAELPEARRQPGVH